ncbi:MAG: hypothetical protein K2J67_08065 [Lachnospiraceae bacterium]|nr:hypothetical protein [Lachnospiraceae bacterium]
MKYLWHYEWVKLPRNIVPEGKGVLGDWGKLASRAAFRKGTSLYCGYINTVILFMYSTEYYRTISKRVLYRIEKIIIVTHDLIVAEGYGRGIRLEDGRITLI